MAAPVKPRERTATIKKASDSLTVLVEMGFPKNRAEKALAATGEKGIQAAADWIMAHVFDPDIDKAVQREYVVYAVPGGDLGRQLDELWDESVAVCGRNGAHKSFPHITLCQFFGCDDGQIPQLVHCLQRVISLQGKAPETFTLKFYSSGTYIGLFLEDQSSSQWLRTTMASASTELAKTGIKMEPHRKQLHMTLAYQFHTDQQKTLEQMCRKVNPKASVKWELRLYSRDPRVGQSEVYRVLYSLTPRNDDELELSEDDFMLMESGEKASTESEGWYVGTSFMTGVTGMFPGNYVEKCAETACWTLHRSWKLTPEEERVEGPPTAGRKQGSQMVSKRVLSSGEDKEMYASPEGLLTQGPRDNYAMVKKKAKAPGGAKPTVEVFGPRLLILVRHAERVDITFGHQWLQYSFDKDGTYHRRNLNMPKAVPIRLAGHEDFQRDTPITEIGFMQARLTGEAMAEQGIQISHVYSSPALRCVQTADSILKGMGADPTVKIKIEQGLFEWLPWCRDGLPTWMTPEELIGAGMAIDKNYKTQVHISQLNPKEKPEDYYRRSHKIAKSILDAASKTGGNVLFVGHAGTLDACSRQLTGGAVRTGQELTTLVQKVPYCGVCTCEETGSGADLSWGMISPPFPTLTHAPNPRYDWRTMRL